MKKEISSISEFFRFSSCLIFSFVAALFMLLTASSVGATPLDGTFRLRELKSELDQQLKAQYISDSDYRSRIKASRVSNLVVGDTEMAFQVYNFAANVYEYRPGKLVAQGKHCNLFIEKENAGLFAEQSAQIFAQIVDNFDNKVFPTVAGWFGEPQIPAEFALPDKRVYIFLLDIHDKFDEGYVAGYFDHRDLEGLFGNQKPVFFMDIKPGEPGNPFDKNNSFYRTLAHELQHMVNFSISHATGQAEQERWLDEGLAMFSEYVFSGEVGADSTRWPPSPHFERFLESPAVNLLSNSKESWFKEDSLFRQYGASFMFVTYMVEKYGGNSKSLQQAFVRELIRTPKKGMAGINELFFPLGISFAQIFCNFVLALHIDDAAAGNGMWGFSDKKSAFGKSAEMIPVKMIRHFASSEAGSFVGSNGHALPNSIAIEEVAGIGNLALTLNCNPAMTPYIAELLPDKSGSIRPLTLSGGQTVINADLADKRRLFILPLALAEQFSADSRLEYSFRSSSNKLMMYPVPNPAFAEQFVIILKSFSGPLTTTPLLRIAFGNLLDTPRLEPVDASQTIFIAHYQIPGNGRGQAFCYYGDDSCSFSFSSVRGLPEVVQTVESDGVTLLVSSPESGMATLSRPDYSISSLPNGAINGPYDVFLETGASATIKMAAALPDKSGLCRINATGQLVDWQTAVDRKSALFAKLPGSGRYYIAQDTTPPVISGLKLIVNASGNSMIQLSSFDALSGINPLSIRATVDQVAVAAPVNADWRVNGLNLGKLEPGQRLVEVEVSDCAGNVARAQIKAAVAASTQLRAETFPNPCSRRAFIKLDCSSISAFAEAKVKIYDVAGHLVNSLEMSPESPGRFATIWDLTDRNGDAVSNGVYFFRATISDATSRRKATGKISVLR